MQQPIGRRQRWAWMAAGLSAVVGVCLCGVSWLWLLLGGAAAMGYYYYLDRVLPERGLATQLAGTLGWLGKILTALTLVWTVAVMGWAAGLADAAFPMVNGFPQLGWVLLDLVAWGTQKGSAACARCSGVLCLFLLALYGVLVAFSLPDVQWVELRPQGEWDRSIWCLALFLMPAGVWYGPCAGENKKGGRLLVFLLPVFAAALAAVTAGVLTQPLATARPVPLYDLAQSVSLFGVVERMEPLLSAALTMGVFSLLSSLACACQHLGDQLHPWNWTGPAACVLAGALMYPVKAVSGDFLAAGALLFWLAIPLLATAVSKSP